MRSLIGKLVNRTGTVPVGSSPVSFPIFGGSSPSEQQMKAFSSNGTLFSIVSRLATATARPTWDLWTRPPSGDDEERELIDPTRSAFMKLWNRPNPHYTRNTFIETVQQHMDLTGEMWWLLIWDRRLSALGPLEMWPVRPDRMRPVPSRDKFIAGYEYSGPNGEKIPLELDEIVFTKMPNPLDPYRGLGPVQSVMVQLDTSKYTAEWNRNFFINSAEPGGIVSYEEKLSDDEWREVTGRWREQHKGVSAAHRVAVLEGGATWIPNAFSMKDMQFAELHQLGRDILREAYGIPKFALGDVDDVNRASAEASKALFGDLLVVPRLERIKESANLKLLPLFGKALPTVQELDYVSPVPADVEGENADRSSRVTDAVALIATGKFDPADTLAALNLPEIKLAPVPKPQPPPPASADQADGSADAPPTDESGAPVFAESPRVRPSRLSNRIEIRAKVDYDEINDDFNTTLAALLAGWRDVSREQRARLAEQVQAAFTANSPNVLANLTATNTAAVDLLLDSLTGIAERSADRVVEEAAGQGVEVEPVPADQGSLTVVAGMTAALLAGGLANAAGREAMRWLGYGRPGAEVARSVDAYLGDLSDAFLRAQLGHALMRAQNMSRLATFERAPAATYYGSEKLDGSTCAKCAAIDGKRLPTLDAMMLAYGGGPYILCLGTIRCRGQAIAVWE